MRSEDLLGRDAEIVVGAEALHAVGEDRVVPGHVEVVGLAVDGHDVPLMRAAAVQLDPLHAPGPDPELCRHDLKGLRVPGADRVPVDKTGVGAHPAHGGFVVPHAGGKRVRGGKIVLRLVDDRFVDFEHRLKFALSAAQDGEALHRVIEFPPPKLQLVVVDHDLGDQGHPDFASADALSVFAGPGQPEQLGVLVHDPREILHDRIGAVIVEDHFPRAVREFFEKFAVCFVVLHRLPPLLL